jgi:hypothetical protein
LRSSKPLTCLLISSANRGRYSPPRFNQTNAMLVTGSNLTLSSFPQVC